MSVYVHCEERREAAVPRPHENVSLRQRQNVIFVSECSEDICLMKNGSNMYLVDNRVKELVIIYDHVHSSHKDEWIQDHFLYPEGAGPW